MKPLSRRVRIAKQILIPHYSLSKSNKWVATQMLFVMSAQSQAAQTDRSIGKTEGLSTDLETIAVLCSAVPEINEDLQSLSARVDELDDRVDEVEGNPADLQTEINDLGKALGQLATNVTSLEETVEEKTATLQSRQDEIEARLDAVEGMFHPDRLDKQRAHVEAQGSSMPFDRGDEFTLVVEEIQGRPDATLRGKLEKVQTFVDVDDPAKYEEGDTVDVTITDLNGTAAHAVPTETFEK